MSNKIEGKKLAEARIGSEVPIDKHDYVVGKRPGDDVVNCPSTTGTVTAEEANYDDGSVGNIVTCNNVEGIGDRGACIYTAVVS